MNLKFFGLFCVVVTRGHCMSLSETAREFECYSQEKVYHGETGKCYKLLTKGPCKEREWLVLQKPKKGEEPVIIKPICVKETCNEGEYYWPVTKTCVESSDKAKLCGDSNGEVLVHNVFGEGECSCQKEPPRARLNGDKKSACHLLYSRGPCPLGQVLTLPRNETSKAICTDDLCHKESLRKRKDGSLPADGILAPSVNGTCYELGTQGPCTEDLVFKVHASFLRPSCASLTTTIFGLQKPQNCYQDENGDCQKRVTSHKRGDAEKYQKELFNSIKNRKLLSEEEERN